MNLHLTLAPFHALISTKVTTPEVEPEVKLETQPEIETILRIFVA